VQNTLTLLCIGPFILAELEEQKSKKVKTAMLQNELAPTNQDRGF
jgi:hypothetical protein